MENRNPNAPKKGVPKKVEPIRKVRDISTIKKILQDNSRNYALFVVGINTNLRASDLLSLKADQVRPIKPGEEIAIKEKKTGKARRITLNKACTAAIQTLLSSEPYRPGDYLFKSQRGAVILPSSLHRLVKSWCRAIRLRGNYGSHSLRKTWGYHQRVTFKVDIPTLMVCFNHSSQKQTLDYLCIQPEEIRSVYQNEL